MGGGYVAWWTSRRRRAIRHAWRASSSVRRRSAGVSAGNEFPGWDVEHAAVLETSLMLHLRPDLVRFDRAVDDAAARHPFYDVVPPPVDFVPASGTLWKATRAASDKGALAWPEIVGSLRDALTVDLPAPAQEAPSDNGALRDGAAAPVGRTAA